ncbi:MAG: protein kinase [Victivallales bacterium]|nr:protein kinase [Victivallales bacterium]
MPQSYDGQRVACELCNAEFLIGEAVSNASPSMEEAAQLWAARIGADASPESSIQPERAALGGSPDVLVRLRDVRASGGDHDRGVPEFELQEVIGRGGMGVVYRARQTSVGRAVAIKMIRKERANEECARSSFLGEAAVTGALDHPNIVPIYDLGTSADGQLFYAMREVKGRSWKSVLGRNSRSENLDILLRVCDAVAFAHANGVLHRDLKPANVMLGDFGEVLVVDWGLAVSLVAGGKAPSLSRSVGLGGTPAYMAPEMACCDTGRFCFATDVYLLGGILYEIMAGIPPHTSSGNAHDCLRAAMENRVPPCRERSELLDIALKAIATDPGDRYVSAKEFQQAVRDYQVHDESYAMTAHATDSMRKAEDDHSYECYSQALFAFREALRLWSGNTAAFAGEKRAVASYARCAYEKEDYDLALSLLGRDADGTGEFPARVRRARDDRQRRRQRIRVLMRAASALALCLLVVLSVAFLWIRRERNQAILAQRSADRERSSADRERANAVEAKHTAEEALAQVLAARAAREEAERESERKHYAAAVLAARQCIRVGEVDQARELLWSTPEKCRRWEWGSLLLQCDQAVLVVGEEAAATGDREGRAGTGFSGRIIGLSHDGERMARHGMRSLEFAETRTGRVIATMDCPGGATEGGHESDLLADPICLSTDGSRLAGYSLRVPGEIWLWDTRTGERLRTVSVRSTPPRSMSISPDGRLLAAIYYRSGGGYECVVWNLRTGTELHRIRHGSSQTSATFSPDGNVLAVGYNGQVDLHSMATGSRMPNSPRYPPFRWAASGIAFSADGTRLAVTQGDGCVTVWSVSDGTEESALRGFDGPVSTAAFSRDGRSIAAGGSDGVVRVWEIDTGQTLLTLRGHSAGITGIRFTADGRWLVTSAADRTARFWDLSGDSPGCTLLSIAELPEAVRQANQQREPAYSGCVLSPTGKMAATSWGRTVVLWDMGTRSYLRAIEDRKRSSVACMAFTPDGRWLATGGGVSLYSAKDSEGGRVTKRRADSAIRLWDVRNGKEARELIPPRGIERTRAISTSCDGRFLAALMSRVYTGDRASSGPVIAAWELGSKESVPVWTVADTWAAWWLASSPDGRQFLTGGGSGWRLWKASTGEVLAKQRRPVMSMSAIASSPEEGVFAIASADGTLQLWDARTAWPTVTLVDRDARGWAATTMRDAGEGTRVSGISFSPDASRLAVARADRTVRILDAATGQDLLRLDAGDATRGRVPPPVQFSPDGLTLATSRGVLWHAFDWRKTRKEYDAGLRARYADWLRLNPGNSAK